MNKLTIKDITFSYEELQPLCIICGEPMYVPEINDINYDRRLQAYEKNVVKPFDIDSKLDLPNQIKYPSSIFDK